MSASRLATRVRRCARVSLAFVFLAMALGGMAHAAGVDVVTLDGKRAGLGEFLAKDKFTLIMVWTTYCPYCREQYPIISAFHTAHSGKDAEVLGISLDGLGAAEAVGAYQKAQAHSFPSVLAEAAEFGPKYEKTVGGKFTGTPTYVMFDRAGKLVGYLDGPVTRAALERALAR